MTKEYFVKLTIALYKVTDLFPENEPLRYQIRQKAVEILSSLIGENPKIDTSHIQELSRNIEILCRYFEVAQAQNWVDKKNLEVLEREYRKIQKDCLAREKVYPKASSQKIVEKTSETSRRGRIQEDSEGSKREKTTPKERKIKILELLKHKKTLTLSEIKNLFFQVSQRTIRRDMEDLIKKGIVARKRIGQKDVRYTLIKTDITTDRLRSMI
ncbi:MAG: hypothetical protein DRN07_00990 [Thermoplasmata archaeon]|nr:MAG: hypothetical protein DRN07_00990 [Thermoplasmata archaeon]